MKGNVLWACEKSPLQRYKITYLNSDSAQIVVRVNGSVKIKFLKSVIFEPFIPLLWRVQVQSNFTEVSWIY